MNESLLHTLLDPELQDLFVALRSFALNILTGRFDPELPRTFDSRLGLETIVRRSVVASDYFKMCSFVVFF